MYRHLSSIKELLRNHLIVLSIFLIFIGYLAASGGIEKIGEMVLAIDNWVIREFVHDEPANQGSSSAQNAQGWKTHFSGSIIQALGSVTGTVFGAIIAFFFGLYSARYVKKINERQDLKLVFDLIDKTHEEEESRNALLLLDYASYPIEFPQILEFNGHEWTPIKLLVTKDDVYSCLRVPSPGKPFEYFTEPEKYIRDCFDSLFVNLTKVAMIFDRKDISMRHLDAVFGFFLARMRSVPAVNSPYIFQEQASDPSASLDVGTERCAQCYAEKARSIFRQPRNAGEDSLGVFGKYLDGFFYTRLKDLLDEHWRLYGDKYKDKKVIKDEVFFTDIVRFSDHVKYLKEKCHVEIERIKT